MYKETYKTKQQKKSTHTNNKSLSKSSQINCSYMTHVSVITLHVSHSVQPTYHSLIQIKAALV